jgi:putative restriction endonuclease
VFLITPDYRLVIPQRIMDEEDGPMVIHGLQEFHSSLLHVPRAVELRPKREILEERFEEFRKAM